MLTQCAVGTGSREDGVGGGGGEAANQQRVTQTHTLRHLHTNSHYHYIKGGAASHQIGCMVCSPSLRQTRVKRWVITRGAPPSSSPSHTHTLLATAPFVQVGGYARHTGPHQQGCTDCTVYASSLSDKESMLDHHARPLTSSSSLAITHHRPTRIASHTIPHSLSLSLPALTPWAWTARVLVGRS